VPPGTVFKLSSHAQVNQSQIRLRGYQIGNHVVGLPPGAPDVYYTQPGSPCNEASIRKSKMVGDLDEGGGRPYKRAMWKERLKTASEKEAETQVVKLSWKTLVEVEASKRLSPREQAIMARGGTLQKY
jgi:hypothetical protein